MQHIKNYVKTLVSKEQQWKLQLLEQWPNIIGTLSNNVKLERVMDNKIFLGVPHSTWAQEIHLLSSHLKKTINAFLKKERIKDIRLRIIPQIKKTVATSRRKNKDYSNNHLQSENFHKYTLTTQDYISIQKIKDQELQTSMINFLMRCKKIKGDNEWYKNH
jgi:hypothetical protein